MYGGRKTIILSSYNIELAPGIDGFLSIGLARKINIRRGGVSR